MRVDTNTAWLEERLPSKRWIRPSDVAAALDVSVTTVYAWMEEGALGDTINLGCSGKPSWRIARHGVIEFARRRTTSVNA